MRHPFFELRAVVNRQWTAWTLPGELAAEIEERSAPVAFEKGAIVFLRGAPADLVFWLRKGFGKLYLPRANGDRTLIAVARSGEPLGSVAHVDAHGYSHHLFEAAALTECALGLVSGQENDGRLRIV